ncbi:MAG TPA: hypothetical protein VF643_11765 [Sphingomonas sp.]|jgi:hypothetical protein
MKTTKFAALLMATTAASAGAQNKDAASFGARENIQQISLSPDGTHVAMIMPMAGQASAVFVVDTVAGGVPKPILQWDCRDFRVRAGIMGVRSSPYVTTQRACDTERVAGPVAGGWCRQRGI